MTVVLTAFFGMANASTANWYGYALYTASGADWQNHFHKTLREIAFRFLWLVGILIDDKSHEKQTQQNEYQ